MTERERLVRVGRVGRPHGLDGEVTVVGSTLDPSELTSVRDFTWRGVRGETRSLTLESARGPSHRLILRFTGCARRADVEPLVNGDLWVDPERLPDPGAGVAYRFQLVGLDVRTEDGRALGTLAEVLTAGSGAIYVVRGERELMIPAVPEFVKRVDLAGRVVTVVVPAGLEDL